MVKPKKAAVPTILQTAIKEKGIIPDHMCDILCDLIALDNVPARRVVQAFKQIANALDVPVEGDVSECSVDQIMKEGGNAAKLQFIDSVQTVKDLHRPLHILVIV
ncbi:hypothetical protein ARMGADRAFT_1039508 [Armillaria gallica]|uniref:Uncharacterized protein n=1 Tax=Armillaria gallica TaxID=47427 RepID=A0A2H3D130_ARMGA|nr:hypothetical protein ARMGADRAFT_1039508 [Armillaria gallica]